jgi:hypothetical protein
MPVGELAHLTFDVQGGEPGLTDGQFFVPLNSVGSIQGAFAAFAGGVQAATSPGDLPLDAPTISGTTITVDDLLQEPERITRDVAELSMQRFYMDRVFSAGGGVTGGALLFEQPNPLATDLYGDREPKEVAPGAVFPLQTFQRGVPLLARPKKIGNKWPVTKEARKRNDTSYIQRQIVQTGNTIRRRIENMGIAELSAVITNQSRFMTGTDWSTYAGTANVSRTGITGPVADIMAAFAFVDLEERGHSMDSLILHPTNAMEAMQAFPGMPLTQIFGQADGAENGMSIRNVFVTPRYTLGRALMFEAGQVGTWRNEFPLEEETEYEGPASTTGAQRWWYQWSISPLFAVFDQFSFMEVRGL